MSSSVSKTHVSEEVKTIYPMVTRLIEEVKKRPQLWNPSHYLHHTRPLIGDNWEEIASVIGNPSKLFTNTRLLSMSNASLTPANLVKTKWKGLRDNFRKEVKKCLRLGESYVPWMHFRACSFLWTVLDTSQLDAEPEQIAELKQKYLGDQEIDMEAFEQTNYPRGNNVDDDDSMDFHDYIFADEMKQAQERERLEQYDPHMPEEGEIITEGNEDEEDLQIIEPVIEQVEVPDDDDDYDEGEEDEELPQPLPQMPVLRISEPRTLNKPPLKKFVPLRIVKKTSALPELTPISKTSAVHAENSPVTIEKSLNSSLSKKDDSDLHFLKSVLPYLKQINSKRKSNIKENIRQLILDEVRKNESPKRQKLDTTTTPKIVKVVSNGTTVKEEIDL